jgi:hypothetical protein
MNNPDNKQVPEVLGCIVCAQPYQVLVEYTPTGRVVECTATSPGGHCIPNKLKPLIACDIHSPREIVVAYNLWRTRMEAESAKALEDEDRSIPL